jgi:hypothetical protein
MQFHDETLAESTRNRGRLLQTRLPGQGASGKIARFPRHCFALIVIPFFFCPPGNHCDG